MATQNKSLCWMDGGLLTVTFDYDDVTLTILVIHIVNNNTRSYTVNATSTSTGKHYAFTINPSTVIDQVVPAGAQNRLDLSVTPSGKLDGVEWSIF